jgi:hypothetical protein
MENNIKLEFTVKMDKAIYEESPWNTKEKFFQKMVIGTVGSDVGFFKRDIKKMEGQQKEDYKIFLKTLKEMKGSINKSINYELVNTNENIEEVKINLSFKLYETPVIDVKRLVESFFFIACIQDNREAVRELEILTKNPTKFFKFLHRDQEKINNTIKMLNHTADFMEEAEKSLVVYKDGVISEYTYKPKNLKM